jgi:hypothetical protein
VYLFKKCIFISVMGLQLKWHTLKYSSHVTVATKSLQTTVVHCSKPSVLYQLTSCNVDNSSGVARGGASSHFTLKSIHVEENYTKHQWQILLLFSHSKYFCHWFRDVTVLIRCSVVVLGGEGSPCHLTAKWQILGDFRSHVIPQVTVPQL